MGYTAKNIHVQAIEILIKQSSKLSYDQITL